MRIYFRNGGHFVWVRDLYDRIGWTLFYRYEPGHLHIGIRCWKYWSDTYIRWITRDTTRNTYARRARYISHGTHR